MRVLISAYACEPGKGSEQEVGWNWALQAARTHEVWVITRANNATAIRSQARQQDSSRIHWVFYELPYVFRFWKRQQRGLHLYYYLWQIGAYLHARRLHARIGFDLVNHVTFVTYWMPSFMSLLPAPFVWGPVGGGESAPRSFYDTFSRQGRWRERLRDVVRRIAALDPMVRATARRAAVVLAATADTARRVAELGASRIETFPHVALTQEELCRLAALPLRDESPFRMVSIGNLLDLKGFHLGIAAFVRHLQRHPDSEYWIVGDGPERQRLERLTRQSGVVDKVRFLGRVPRNDVFAVLADCDVVVHPTLHDSGGFVCLEAMAAGRPVICFALGGPDVLVDDGSGVRILASQPSQAIADIADAMTLLATDAQERARMAAHARSQVRECFNWDQKGLFIDELYRQVQDSHAAHQAATVR